MTDATPPPPDPSTRSALAVLLYQLASRHVPLGELEQAVRRALEASLPASFDSPHAAEWAIDAADRLLARELRDGELRRLFDGEEEEAGAPPPEDPPEPDLL